jgi:hypothetical protein
VLGRGREHIGRAVGEDREAHALFLEPREHARHFGERVDVAIAIHELRPKRRVGKAERLHGDIERFAGHLPERRVSAHEAPEPAVLQLLLSPQRGKLVGLAAKRGAAARGRRVEIVERAVSVEDAGGDVAERGQGRAPRKWLPVIPSDLSDER